MLKRKRKSGKYLVIPKKISNFAPKLDTGEYSEGETCYYYVERYAADSWESGEILEREI